MVDERLVNIENYENLANAIIVMAARDYVAVYGAKNSQAQYSAETLEKFFRGDRFRLFTHGQIDPEYLIQRLRQKARKKHKKGDVDR